MEYQRYDYLHIPGCGPAAAVWAIQGVGEAAEEGRHLTDSSGRGGVVSSTQDQLLPSWRLEYIITHNVRAQTTHLSLDSMIVSPRIQTPGSCAQEWSATTATASRLSCSHCASTCRRLASSSGPRLARSHTGLYRW